VEQSEIRKWKIEKGKAQEGGVKPPLQNHERTPDMIAEKFDSGGVELAVRLRRRTLQEDGRSSALGFGRLREIRDCRDRIRWQGLQLELLGKKSDTVATGLGI